MKQEKYKLSALEENMLFEFISKGPKGNIAKRIRFVETNIPSLYNLEFGDIIIETGEIDYKATSDNDDAMKVLATVADATRSFLENHSNDWVFAEGITRSRTRLYQIKINRFLSEISTDFEVYGRADGEWKTFSTGFS